MDKVNGYSLFVQEISNKNRGYGNFHQASKVAAPLWKALPNSKKEEYKRRAKQINSVDGRKYNSQGVPLDMIEQEEAEKTQAQLRMVKEIKDYFADVDYDVMLDLPFYVGHLNYHVAPPTTEREVLPAELAILKFSLKDGLQQCFHRLIFAGEIRHGFYSNAKEQSERTHKLLNPMIGVRSKLELYNDIVKFMTNSNKRCPIPIIYAMPDDSALNDSLVALRNFLMDLQFFVQETYQVPQRGEFCVYALPTLLRHFYNDLREKYREDLSEISESLANKMLSKDTHMYKTREAACEVHETDENVNCSRCKVVSCAFAFFEHVLPLTKVDPMEDYHVPGNHIKLVTNKIEQLHVPLSGYYKEGQFDDAREEKWGASNDLGLESNVRSMSLNDFPALGSASVPQPRKWGAGNKQSNNFAGQFVQKPSAPEPGTGDFPALKSAGSKKRGRKN